MQELSRFIEKNKWFKVGKWKEPVFLQDIIIRAYLKQKKTGVLPYYPTLYFVTDFKQFILLSEFNLLKKKVKTDLTSNHLQIAKQIRQEVRQAISDINSFNPRKITSDVIKRYGELVEVHAKQSLRFIIMGYVLEEVYPKLLPKNISLVGQSFTAQSLLALAALPKKLMPMIAENISLLKIVITLKQKKSVVALLKKHIHQFSWMNSICWWDEPFTKDYYLEQADKLAKNNPKKLLKSVIQNREKQYRAAEKILSELKIKYPLVWEYLGIIRDMTDLREESWDAVSRAGVRLRPLFKSLAAKNFMSYNQLIMLSVNEMLKLANGKLRVDINEINQCLISFGIFNTTKTVNQPIIFSGKKAQDLSILIEGKKSKVSQLFGLTIWPGKTKGIVRVLQSADEISKVKIGEILVCPMTDPDYMPAIKKVKALVTDQGGVLCHAAIVARELQKICLVGTQIATQIFKTGDKVEVDADRGVVRKI